MQGVEFEEERDLVRSPEHVRIRQPAAIPSRRRRFTKSQAQTVILLLVFAGILFASSGAVFYKVYIDRQLGLVISPESLSEFEQYQLPENIRMYIK